MRNSQPRIITSNHTNENTAHCTNNHTTDNTKKHTTLFTNFGTSIYVSDKEIVRQNFMATPYEKLAQSLEQLRKLQNEKGIAVIRANDLSRTHKERLIANGFLQEVIKGWYISARPDEQEGNTTSWYMSFWYFASVYLNARFGKDWCLSPEQSLSPVNF